MHPNAQLIQDFYEAFGRRDAEAMAACYHPHIVFSDPVFGELNGEDASDMWRMLCARGEDLHVEARGILADDHTGRAHWDATYTFSGTGRKVHNKIDATFELRDGRIVRHDDRFNAHAWTSQALGLPGRVFGGLGFFQKKLRARALSGLDQYKKKQKETP